jgi:hypothetical protein
MMNIQYQGMLDGKVYVSSCPALSLSRQPREYIINRRVVVEKNRFPMNEHRLMVAGVEQDSGGIVVYGAWAQINVL